MTKHSSMKPLALAVGMTLALAACGKSEQAAAPAPASAPAKTSTAAAPASSGSTAANAAPQSVFDVNELGASNEACQDFNGFVNAKWIAANPIPNDHTRWGAFDQLAEKSLDEQHEIAEGAAKNVASAQPGSIEQKIGWLYAAGMDEDAINKAGFDPIKPQLAAIDALKNGADVADFLDKSFNDGDNYVFMFGSGADYKDASQQIGYVFQDGLGLPTKEVGS